MAAEIIDGGAQFFRDGLAIAEAAGVGHRSYRPSLGADCLQKDIAFTARCPSHSFEAVPGIDNRGFQVAPYHIELWRFGLPALCAAPHEERDLLISAYNTWVLSLDNMSNLPNWLSDALCRVSSGGGYATRALRTDLDEVVLQIARPIILNGIPDLANRPDLGERAIILTLPAIPDEQRIDEEEFWKNFECAWPFILGGLFDALSASLRNLPTVHLEKKPDGRFRQKDHSCGKWPRMGARRIHGCICYQ